MFGTLKNSGSVDIAIPVFGVVLSVGESFDLVDFDDLHRLRLSEDIKEMLEAGSLEVYDTTPTLIPTTGIELWIQDQLSIRPRFEAYNATDSTAFNTNAEAAQPLDTTSVETPSIVLAPENTHVDLNFDGAVDIQAEVSMVCDSGSGMSGVETWIELNGVFVPGTLRGTVLHEGEVCSMSMGRSSLAVSVDDEVTIVSQRTSGSLGWRYPASGCRLRIRRVE